MESTDPLMRIEIYWVWELSPRMVEGLIVFLLLVVAAGVCSISPEDN
jgi:hypothetical protein